jgi:ACR3 family arsenite transporter
VPVEDENDVPPLKGLSLLDRFLVVWIVLAMAIGILLGNFVDSVGPELQKGKFVGVSVPIGESAVPVRVMMHLLSSLAFRSCGFNVYGA